MFGKSARPAPTRAQNDMAVTETAPCQKSLRLCLAPDAVAPIRAAVLAEFQKQAALPGFRKGKAPAELVERQHGAAIQEETVHRATKHALEQATQAHQLKPVGPFEVRAAHFSATEGLTVEASVEVEPSFALGTYRGIPLVSTPVEVTEEDMARALAQLQESMAKLVPTGQGEAKERKVPAVDDELAKDLGFKTLTELNEHVRAKLLEHKCSAQRQTQEAALCDALLARHAVEVPPRLVQHQTERLTRDCTARLLLSGSPEEQVRQEVEKFAQQLRTSAERHVKLGFILERIAEAESIAVTQDEVVGRLWGLSRQWRKDPAEVRKLLDERGLWPSIISAIRQEKTMAFLMNAAVNGEAPNRPKPPV